MSRKALNDIAISMMVIGAVVVVASLIAPATTSALPQYATATGQACGVCHVNPAGGGALTARGQAFAAIPTHATDPAGAFTQSGAAAPAATPTTAPAASPTAAPTKPAASPTAAASPVASPTAAPKPTVTATPGTLPTTGGIPLLPFAMGGGSFLVALGWSLRRLIRR